MYRWGKIKLSENKNHHPWALDLKSRTNTFSELSVPYNPTFADIEDESNKISVVLMKSDFEALTSLCQVSRRETTWNYFCTRAKHHITFVLKKELQQMPFYPERALLPHLVFYGAYLIALSKGYPVFRDTVNAEVCGSVAMRKRAFWGKLGWSKVD